MNTPSFIAPMSLLVSFAKRALQAWRERKRDVLTGKTRSVRMNFVNVGRRKPHIRDDVYSLIFFLASLSLINAQDFHYETNVVKVPCKLYHYYGVEANGSIVNLGTVPDHDVGRFEGSIHASPSHSTIFRVNTPLDGVATVRHEGPRTVKLPVVTPPLPAPLTNQAKSFSASPLDTTPPTVEISEIRPAIITDFPYSTPHTRRCINNLGVFADELGTGTTSNRLQISYLAESNHCYIVWWSSNLVDNVSQWVEFPNATWCQFATNQAPRSNVVYLPVMPTQQRFYWLRNS